MRKFLMLGGLVVARALSFEDECSSYPTCQVCLDIPPNKSEGGRKNCGWCHSPVVYASGSEGPHCIDIRDKPWKCMDLYDTYKCQAGYTCNVNDGHCELAPAGQGIRLDVCNATCHAPPAHHSPTPAPAPRPFKCNLDTYKCEACGKGEENCFAKEVACKNCKRPPPKSYKCDRSDVKNPQCQACQNASDAGCADRATACIHCANPSPQSEMSCNTKTLKCEKADQAMPAAVCNASCGHFVPPELQGVVWRGFEAHRGFGLGEWDFKFDTQTVTIKQPDGKTLSAKVESAGGGQLSIIDTYGKKLNCLLQEVSSGDETKTVVLATLGPGQPFPDSVGQAVAAAGDVWVLSSCNSWKPSCSFASVFGLGAAPADDCNKYPDCHTCISAREGQRRCGWCIGGGLDYKDRGITKFQCGGFVAGQPAKFVCPGTFSTVDCKGFSCMWSAATPTCKASDPGAFGTEAACDAVCKPTVMAKCNPVTKKCENCTAGEPDCKFTMDGCSAFCNAPKAKCNTATGQCAPCDAAKDANCTQTAGSCAGACHAPSPRPPPPPDLRNVTNGTCVNNVWQCGCDPLKDQSCMLITKDKCHSPCNSSDSKYYKCDWDSFQCKVTTDKDPDKRTLQDCQAVCVKPQFAKCSKTAPYLCVPCDNAADKSCVLPQANCEAEQRAGKCTPGIPKNLQGVWRGNAIHNGFIRGEYDVKFDATGASMEIAFTEGATGDKKKWHAAVKAAPSATAEAGATALSFTFDAVPAGDSTFGAKGQTLQGILQEKDGDMGEFKMLYLAIGKAGASVAQFDDAMPSGVEFVLAACAKAAPGASAGACDFSPADPTTAPLEVFI